MLGVPCLEECFAVRRVCATDCPVSQVISTMAVRTKREPVPIRARSEEQRQAKLDAILAAALDVFAEKGFSDARLDDVAARAGVAKGTIYLYVASKEALFEALIHTGIAAS